MSMQVWTCKSTQTRTGLCMHGTSSSQHHILDRKNADAFWRLCDNLKQTVEAMLLENRVESCMAVTVLQRE